MKTVKLRDDHIHGVYNRMEVVLCEAKCEGFNGPEPFLTGFRFDPSGAQGMFSEREEPVQVIEEKDDGYHLTTTNCTTMSRTEIDQLLADGKLVRKDNDGHSKYDMSIRVIG